MTNPIAAIRAWFRKGREPDDMTKALLARIDADFRKQRAALCLSTLDELRHDYQQAKAAYEAALVEQLAGLKEDKE